VDESEAEAADFPTALPEPLEPVGDSRFGGKIPLNGSGSCRLDFASVSAFDRHRIGAHSHDFSLERPDGRRCMAEDEMTTAGMVIDRNGRWSIPPTEGQKESLRRLRASTQPAKGRRATKTGK
jgi:hypothetical protein